MRFALIGPAHPFRGGIAQYTASLFRALNRENEALLVSFVRQYPGLLFPGVTQHDESREPVRVSAEPLFDPLSPRSWRASADRILRYQPEAVVIQWWQPFFGFGYRRILDRLQLKSAIPVFFLCHNIFSHENLGSRGRSAYERLLVSRAFRKADGFLVHSHRLNEQIRRFNPQAPIRHIFHPLYDFYAEWDAGEPPHLSLNSKPVLLFFGKVRRYKGLETFLQALQLVGKSMDFTAVVAGEFYLEEQRYQKLAVAYGIEKQMVWKNRYIANEEVPPIFRSADLVVLPYRTATQSGVVPLAYQFDIPVVASDVGGLSEVVLHGRTGFLVPPGDPPALAGRILEYFRENRKPGFQQEIRQFKRQLSWQQVTDQILDLSREVLLSRSR